MISPVNAQRPTQKFSHKSSISLPKSRMMMSMRATPITFSPASSLPILRLPTSLAILVCQCLSLPELAFFSLSSRSLAIVVQTYWQQGPLVLRVTASLPRTLSAVHKASSNNTLRSLRLCYESLHLTDLSCLLSVISRNTHSLRRLLVYLECDNNDNNESHWSLVIRTLSQCSNMKQLCCPIPIHHAGFLLDHCAQLHHLHVLFAPPYLDSVIDSENDLCCSPPHHLLSSLHSSSTSRFSQLTHLTASLCLHRPLDWKSMASLRSLDLHIDSIELRKKSHDYQYLSLLSCLSELEYMRISNTYAPHGLPPPIRLALPNLTCLQWYTSVPVEWIVPMSKLEQLSFALPLQNNSKSKVEPLSFERVTPHLKRLLLEVSKGFQNPTCFPIASLQSLHLYNLDFTHHSLFAAMQSAAFLTELVMSFCTKEEIAKDDAGTLGQRWFGGLRRLVRLRLDGFLRNAFPFAPHYSHDLTGAAASASPWSLPSLELLSCSTTTASLFFAKCQFPKLHSAHLIRCDSSQNKTTDEEKEEEGDQKGISGIRRIFKEVRRLYWADNHFTKIPWKHDQLDLSKLQELYVEYCSSLSHFPLGPSLLRLVLCDYFYGEEGCSKIESLISTLPVSLHSLKIHQLDMSGTQKDKKRIGTKWINLILLKCPMLCELSLPKLFHQIPGFLSRIEQRILPRKIVFSLGHSNYQAPSSFFESNEIDSHSC